MKKSILLTAILILLLSVLTACGSDDKTTDKNSDTKTEQTASAPDQPKSHDGRWNETKGAASCTGCHGKDGYPKPAASHYESDGTTLNDDHQKCGTCHQVAK